MQLVAEGVLSVKAGPCLNLYVVATAVSDERELVLATDVAEPAYVPVSTDCVTGPESLELELAVGICNRDLNRAKGARDGKRVEVRVIVILDVSEYVRAWL